jgi:hypothetical protein
MVYGGFELLNKSNYQVIIAIISDTCSSEKIIMSGTTYYTVIRIHCFKLYYRVRLHENNMWR